MSSSDGSTGSSVTAAFIAAAFRLDAMVAQTLGVGLLLTSVEKKSLKC